MRVPVHAFVCAMPLEARPLVRGLRLARTEVAGVHVHTGRLGGRDVIAAVTGMGTHLATVGVEELLDALAVEHVAVVGICGAVDDTTPIGTLITPASVVDSATGASFAVPAAAGAAGGGGRGLLWTTDELITDPDALAALRARGVIALDMETAAIAAVCERRSVPWSLHRVISDRATDGSVDAEVFQLSRQDGTPDGRAVARYVVRHPGRVPGLVGLARGMQRATALAAASAIRGVAGC